MRSPLAESQREALIEAMLPEVAFDGWSRPALRVAARRIGMPAGEALALFPGGTADLVACFSRWADLRMLDRLETEALDPLRIPERIALAITTRLEVVAPSREAVRRALSLLTLPQHMPLGLRLLYETVDAAWYGTGDRATERAHVRSGAPMPSPTRERVEVRPQRRPFGLLSRQPLFPATRVTEDRSEVIPVVGTLRVTP